MSKVIESAPAARGGLDGWTEGNMDFGSVRQTGAVRKRTTNKADKSFGSAKLKKQSR
jgi:hypothetical protein